ncbi:molecular chaperone TorD family protein [Vibrio sp. SS-MA-C1-2]|uniref:TorD/DmsD family molecular chaperone n=1 Tax=Vibrio sp. SS-MA-C1-2 TaxID=2908646 RepID=UPI001F21834C|nr:molecular chaperone TorD family protein [Vibrio sp. SS-MA-C1-2]UJF18149.1 molecular chaperone TorD family protein [Vibrio sp. SS-MA-C1-2]
MEKSNPIQFETAQLTEEQLMRIDIYGLLATLLRSAPSQELLEWLQQIEVPAVNDLPPTQDGNIEMAWSQLKEASAKVSTAQIEEEYQDLFIGIGRGEVLPFLSWYLSGTLMEKPLVQLRQNLKEFGFSRQNNVFEPEDHMAALLEVMAMLIQTNDTEKQCHFFEQHILPWYQKFSFDVKQAKSSYYYTHVAELLTQFLHLEKGLLLPLKVDVKVVQQ